MKHIDVTISDAACARLKEWLADRVIAEAFGPGEELVRDILKGAEHVEGVDDTPEAPAAKPQQKPKAADDGRPKCPCGQPWLPPYQCNCGVKFCYDCYTAHVGNCPKYIAKLKRSG